MKKLKYLIASFSVLLLLIPSFVFADGDPEPEEDPESDLGYVDPYAFYQYGDQSELDSYFYNNFILLPYLESDGTQYIDSGIKATNSIDVDVYYSGFNNLGASSYLYGVSYDNRFMYGYYTNTGVIHYYYGSQDGTVNYNLNPYDIYHQYNRANHFYIDEDYDFALANNTFNSTYNIGIFAAINNSNGDPNFYSVAKIYYFSIYDNSSDEMVRSFYPAKQKSNGSYGLYDAINKIFYTSSAIGHPFENPEGSDAQLGLMARIQLFLGTSISSIGEILYFASHNSMILFFLAIGLAGVAIRWAKRVVHF